jgi:hypothetical protein
MASNDTAAAWTAQAVTRMVRESRWSARCPASPISRTLGAANAIIITAIPPGPPPASWMRIVRAKRVKTFPSTEMVRPATTTRRSRWRQMLIRAGGVELRSFVINSVLFPRVVGGFHASTVCSWTDYRGSHRQYAARHPCLRQPPATFVLPTGRVAWTTIPN